MRILVTAGATEVPIDRVRAITNIFSGRTGTEIAMAFGHDECGFSIRDVTLLTSNPRLAKDMEPWETGGGNGMFGGPSFRIVSYCTFDELAALMEREIRTDKYDLIIHSAAVSDYSVSGVEVQQPDGAWTATDTGGKISSLAPGMRLTLAPTPKLLNQIRDPWGFTGKLVQFKLEVGITDEELIARGRAALERSGGDLCVANCLEWMLERAYLIGADGSVEMIARKELPHALIARFTRS